jgi:hypothetical protein
MKDYSQYHNNQSEYYPKDSNIRHEYEDEEGMINHDYLDEDKKKEIIQSLDDEINEMRAKYFLKQPNEVKPVSRKESFSKQSNKSYKVKPNAYNEFSQEDPYEVKHSNSEVLSEFQSSQQEFQVKQSGKFQVIKPTTQHIPNVVNHDLEYYSDEMQDDYNEERNDQRGSLRYHNSENNINNHTNSNSNNALFASFGKPLHTYMNSNKHNTKKIEFYQPAEVDYRSFSKHNKSNEDEEYNDEFNIKKEATKHTSSVYSVKNKGDNYSNEEGKGDPKQINRIDSEEGHQQNKKR